MPFKIEGFEYEQTAGGPQRVGPKRAPRSSNFSLSNQTRKQAQRTKRGTIHGAGYSDPETGISLETAGDLIGGFAKGLVEDPIIGFGIRKIFGEDVQQDLLDEIGRSIGDSTAGSVGRFVGEWLPIIFGGAKAYTKGAGLAINSAAKLNAMGKLKGGGNILFKRDPAALAKLTDAERLAMVGTGMTERVAQGIGGSLGLGAFEGAREYGETEDFGHAARAAAIGTAFGAVFEGGLIALKPVLAAAKGKIVKADLELLGPMAKAQAKKVRKTEGLVAKSAAEFDALAQAHPQETELYRASVAASTAAGTRLAPAMQQVKNQADLRKRISGLKKHIKKRGETGPSQEKLAALQEQLAALGTGKGSPKNALRKLRAASNKANKKKRDALRKAEGAIGKAEKKKFETRQQLKQDEQTLANYQYYLDNPHEYFSAKFTTFDERAFPIFVDKILMKTIRTPEGIAGKMGGIAKITMIEPLQRADMYSQLANLKTRYDVEKWFGTTLKNMGGDKKLARKDPEYFMDLFDAWELKSNAGVRDYMQRAGRGEADIVGQLKVFSEMKTRMRDIAKELEAMGAEPLMTQADLTKRGVMEYLPQQIIRGLKDAQLRKGLMKTLGARGTDAWMMNNKAQGLAKMGSFDHARVMNGSLKSKLADPDLKTIYESNPFRAFEHYSNGGQYRIAYGKEFGLDGEMRLGIVKGIRNENAAMAAKEQGITLEQALKQGSGARAEMLADGIFDQAFGRHHLDIYAQNISRIMLSGQVMSKLGLAVIPNLSQSMNVIAYGDFKHAYKAFRNAGHDRKHVEESLGILQSMFDRGAVNTQSGATREAVGNVGLIAEAAERGAANVLKWTGFTGVEMFNRRISGATGMYIYKDLVGGLASGKLIGRNYDEAIRKLESMNIHPNDVKALLKGYREQGEKFFQSELGQELEHRAVYRAAQITQFTPGSLRRPAYWDHPVGKIITQFKSFALNHGRFMKDQIFAEAAQGNMKPLAKVLALYPVAGEIIGDVKSIAKMKPNERRGLERIVGNFTAVGGLGLFTDTIQAAAWGGMSDSFLGPTAGDFFDLGESLLTADPQRFLRHQANNPTIQGARTLVTGVGYALAEGAKATGAIESGELFESFRQPRTRNQ